MKEVVYFGAKEIGGGVLDIDANTVNSIMENPIKNIYFENPKKWIL